MEECSFLVWSTNIRLHFPSIHTVAHPPGFSLLLSKCLLLLSWLCVLQGQAKLIITTVVIDRPFWASSVLASGLLAPGLSNAISAYNFNMLTFTRISWILMSRALIHDNVKRRYKELNVVMQNWGFLLGEDTILRLGSISALYLEVYYALMEGITVLPLTLGPLMPSCFRTQCGGKQHKVQKAVSENTLNFCVPFKIHLWILSALYLVSLIKWQVYSSRWEIPPPIKMALCLFSGVEDTQTFCDANLKTISSSSVSAMIKIK